MNTYLLYGGLCSSVQDDSKAFRPCGREDYSFYEGLDEKEKRDEVYRILNLMPKRVRKCGLLYLRGNSIKEIKETMGVKRGKVISWLIGISRELKKSKILTDGGERKETNERQKDHELRQNRSNPMATGREE